MDLEDIDLAAYIAALLKVKEIENQHYTDPLWSDNKQEKPAIKIQRNTSLPH